jgi:hypothetical protein
MENTGICIYVFYFHLPWRRGAVDIASTSGMRRPEFESHQGIRFLGKHSSAVVYKMTEMLKKEK